ncbi:MAG: hypothetical protein JWR74_1299 [Polaromonas sp.]|jgi:general secretion pathway protein C|nr:hypothetical protein [Polaromonas sp.]
MQTDAYRLWSTRIVTFSISVLAAASAMYWGLKGFGPAAPSAPYAVLAEQMPPLNAQAIARALGGGQAAVASVSNPLPVSSRYDLIGVVAGQPRAGAALIAVDGQEARPVRVGTLVDNDMLLESVGARQAVLVSSTETSKKIVLDMPKLAE